MHLIDQLEQFWTMRIAERNRHRLALKNSHPSSPSPPPDPDATFRAEYRAHAEYLAAMGISEENYLRSRNIDIGKLRLSNII